MRYAAQRLALFFIAITITRVAFFVSFGLKIGWMGWAFALGLGYGVYLFAYSLRFPNTFWAALFGLAAFMVADLFFNEMELVRTLSAENFVATDSYFLGFRAAELRQWMQVGALVFGAFPTIAAGMLGWLQSGMERVQSLRTRTWFGKIGVGIMASFNKYFPETEDRGARLPGISASGSGKLLTAGGNTGKMRWEELSSEDRANLPRLSAGQIVARYGGSPRRARMWKEWVKDGKG